MGTVKMVSTIVLSLIIVSLSTHHVIANEIPNSEEISKEVSNNISEEYITCSTFYGFVAEAIRRSGEIETARKMVEARDAALQFALTAARKGRTQKMAEKVTLARLNLNMKSMTKEIDNNLDNISILLNSYADQCKENMENPDKLMAEWSDKILKKYHIK